MSGEGVPPEASVQVRCFISGCEVTVSFSTAQATLKEQMLSVIRKLEEIGLEPLAHRERRRAEDEEEQVGEADPLTILSRESEVPIEDLKFILGIKGNAIQIYRANQYRLSDAISVLLFINEKALGKPYTPYNDLPTLLEANHIKTPTPLPNVCFNLIRDGTIEKKAYEDSKQIVLTPGGEKKAVKVLTNPDESKATKTAVSKKPAKKTPKRKENA